MSKEAQDNYKEIRREVEEACRQQLQNEVEKRKVLEEAYYQKCEEIKKYDGQIEKLSRELNDMAEENRKLLSCQMSIWMYIKTKWSFWRKEKALVKRGIDFWQDVFDPAYYAKTYPVVVAQVGNDKKALLKHFVTIGTYQSLRGCEAFDVNRYLDYNRDVAEASRLDRRDAYIHYILYGKAEGRSK